MLKVGKTRGDSETATNSIVVGLENCCNQERVSAAVLTEKCVFCLQLKTVSSTGGFSIASGSFVGRVADFSIVFTFFSLYPCDRLLNYLPLLKL